MNTIKLLINRISTCRERYKLKDKEAHRTYHSPVHSDKWCCNPKITIYNTNIIFKELVD